MTEEFMRHWFGGTCWKAALWSARESHPQGGAVPQHSLKSPLKGSGESPQGGSLPAAPNAGDARGGVQGEGVLHMYFPAGLLEAGGLGSHS